jgi:hypothetical protein
MRFVDSRPFHDEAACGGADARGKLALKLRNGWSTDHPEGSAVQRSRRTCWIGLFYTSELEAKNTEGRSLAEAPFLRVERFALGDAVDRKASPGKRNSAS